MRLKASRFKKKGLDRKTNLQDLMKIETEEIFVLTKAKVGGTKNWSKLLSINQRERLDKKSKRNEPRKQRFNVVAWRG